MKKTDLLMLLPCLAAGATSCADAKQEARPNILWVMIEDWSTDLGCYGTAGVETPYIDKIAEEGMLYMNAYTTAPVSSASRSAMMSGFYQNAVHGNQHRLMESEKLPLPEGIKPIPFLMAEGGYRTHICGWKTDVNYLPASRDDLFQETLDWKDRKEGEKFFGQGCAEGQPWFARMTFQNTHRSWDRDPVNPIDIKDVEIPPYYVDNDFVRRDWANGLEQLQIVDREVGEMMLRLEAEGYKENTIVIFMGDNGRCHFRGKQFLYEPGTKVPMIVRWPGKIKAGSVCETPVISIDICKTCVDLAGVTPEVPLQGLNLFGDEIKERDCIFTARDKMDQTHDAMRCVRRKDGWKLIHNLMPERAYLQYNQYKEGGYAALAEMSYLYLTGKLNKVQAAFFADHKPEFELYNLNEDPYEINNLAGDERYAKIQAELLTSLNDWRDNVIHDEGVTEQFRALNVYPKTNPEASVDLFQDKNKKNYDYNKVGWPSWYPTRSAAEWKRIRDEWVPYLFREPGTYVPQANSTIQSMRNTKRQVAQFKQHKAENEAMVERMKSWK